MAEPIDLTLTDGIELPTPGVQNTVPKAAVDARATKYHIALGDTSPGIDQLKTELDASGEARIREQAQQEEILRRNETRLGIIDEMLKQGNVSPDQQDLIMGLSDEQLPNLNTILEEQFVNNLQHRVLSHPELSDNTQKALEEDYDGTNIDLDLQAQFGAKFQVLQRIKEDDDAARAARGWPETIGNVAKWFIPLDTTIRNLAPSGSEPNYLSTLPGVHTEEYREWLWSLEPAEFEKEIQAKISKLLEYSVITGFHGNPDDVSMFINDLYEYSGSRQFQDQMFATLDAVSLVPISAIAKFGVKGIKRMGAAAKAASKTPTTTAETITKRFKSKNSETVVSVTPRVAVRNATKAVNKALANKDPKVHEVLDAAGLTEDAAKVAVADARVKMAEVSARLEGASPELAAKLQTDVAKIQFDELSREIPLWWNPEAALRGIGNMSANAQRELRQFLDQMDSMIGKAIGQKMVVRRLTPEALEQGMRETISRASREARAVPFNFREILPEDTVANLGRVVAQWGYRDGVRAFPTPELADTYARKTYGWKTFAVKPSGGKYVIETIHDMDETTQGVRALMTEGNDMPPSNLGYWARHVLGGDSVKLSKFDTANRSVTSHATQAIAKIAHDLVQPIQALPSKYKEDFNRILEANRDYKDPATGKRGQFYQSVGEIQQAYMDINKRMPREDEIKAYFAAVKFSDMDYMFRNIQVYLEKAREGFQRVSVAKAEFEGRKVTQIPWKDKVSGTVIVHDGAKLRVWPKGDMSKAEMDSVDELISKRGYHAIETFNPTDSEMMKAFELSDEINFILTKDAKYDVLSQKQLSYDPGGHVKYRDGHYVKQPQIIWTGKKRQVHIGDISFANAKSAAEGREIAESVETARLLLKAKDMVGLAAHLKKTLPYTVKEFQAMFVGKSATFSLDHPFTWVKEGVSTTDATVKFSGKTLHELYQGLHSTATSPYNHMAKLNKTFMGERQHNLMRPTDVGTELNPVWQRGAPRLIDPLTTMTGAFLDLVRNKHFRSYQISAAESWMARYGDTLAGAKGLVGKLPARQSRNMDPVRMLNQAEFNPNTEFKHLQEAKSQRNIIRRLLDTETRMARSMNYVQGALMDSVYNRKGDGKTYQMIENVSERMLPWIKDPSGYFRTWAFHTKQGTFNPIQMAVQGQTLFVIGAVSNRGLQGVGAATLMRSLFHTTEPGIIDTAAKIASKLRVMSETEFKESHRWFNETGLDNVGRETTLRSDQFEDKLFRSKAGAFYLNKGPMFFNATERFVRHSAWNASYLEFVRRGEFAAGRMTTADALRVQDRTADLFFRMTRDSNSVWQHGPLTSFGQFLSYQARTLDLMLGKRLTKIERFRLAGVIATMYGIPTLVGTFTPGFSWMDDVREHAAHNNIDIDEGIISAMANGVMASLFHLATGQTPNVGERYGTASTFIEDAFKNFADDETYKDFFMTLVQVGMGASGSIVGDILEGVVPLFTDTKVMLSNNTFSPQTFVEDVATAVKSFSVANSGTKLWRALNTGKYVNSHAETLTEVSKGQAWFYALSGLQPGKINDIYAMSLDNKSEALSRKQDAAQIGELARKMLLASERGDDNAMMTFKIQIDTILKTSNLDPQERENALLGAYVNDPVAFGVIKTYMKNGLKNGTAEERARILKQKGY